MGAHIKITTAQLEKKPLTKTGAWGSGQEDPEFVFRLAIGQSLTITVPQKTSVGVWVFEDGVPLPTNNSHFSPVSFTAVKNLLRGGMQVTYRVVQTGKADIVPYGEKGNQVIRVYGIPDRHGRTYAADFGHPEAW